MIKIEIKSIFRKVLFTHESETATVKKAVEEAVKNSADLSGAYLSGADLSGAYLSGAYLSGADLSGAYLSGAYLSGADLSGADLSGAYLSGAYLSGADLSGADLSGADLSGANLYRADLSGANLYRVTKLPLFCKWSFGITDGLIHIGCEKRSLSDWKTFLQSDEVILTPRDSEDFKQIVKVIKAMIAYLEG